jgi:hypothetical protein
MAATGGTLAGPDSGPCRWHLLHATARPGGRGPGHQQRLIY